MHRFGSAGQDNAYRPTLGYFCCSNRMWDYFRIDPCLAYPACNQLRVLRTKIDYEYGVEFLRAQRPIPTR